jgi:hypothetical protein
MTRTPSNASFERVEEKRAEMSFFLERLVSAGPNYLAFRSYFCAFASAAMSVLFVLDAARKRIDSGFEDWYAPRRRQITEEDPISRYVLARRSEAVHVGETRVRSMRMRHGGDGDPIYEFFFSFDPESPEPVAVDVLSASEHTHNLVWDLVEDVGKAFPRATADYLLEADVLDEEGLTVEDVEAELGFPCGWTFIEGFTAQQRLDALRGGSPPVVAHRAFESVLARFEGTGEDLESGVSGGA